MVGFVAVGVARVGASRVCSPFGGGWVLVALGWGVFSCGGVVGPVVVEPWALWARALWLQVCGRRGSLGARGGQQGARSAVRLLQH